MGQSHFSGPAKVCTTWAYFLGTEIIPKKGGPTPPRNAAYIFRIDGTGAFLPPSKIHEFVQCFNYAKGAKAKNNFTNRFYCGKGSNGNLDVPESDFDRLHGRICATGAPDFTPGGPISGV